jgi:hypothetical protein
MFDTLKKLSQVKPILHYDSTPPRNDLLDENELPSFEEQTINLTKDG